jgi:uncharacterized membrane protein (DUF373 family)
MMLQYLTQFAAGTAKSVAGCTPDQTKFGIPTWYKYLPGETDGGACRIANDFDIAQVDALLSIGLAVIEILLFVAGIVAVCYIIYGGFRYLLSQGNPENTAVAKDAIINAIIGLAIAIIASGLVRFLASTLSS